MLSKKDILNSFHTSALKLPMEEIYHGGVSAARNPRIQNMLRMIGYGDNLGTGFPEMVEVWENTWGEKPVLNERYELLIVDLSFGRKKSKNSHENPHENPHEKIDALDVQIMAEINNNSRMRFSLVVPLYNNIMIVI